MNQLRAPLHQWSVAAFKHGVQPINPNQQSEGAVRAADHCVNTCPISSTAAD